MTIQTHQVGQGTAVINGITIGYYGRHTGQGAPKQTVLVFHGALGNAQTTLDFANELAELRPDVSVFQIDNPGHGSSEGRAFINIQDISEVVQSFVSFMQESEIFTEEIVLIGHSMGGTIAAQTIIDGFLAKRLVMMQSAAVWPSMAFLADSPAEVLPDAFHELMVNEFEAIEDVQQSQALIERIPEMKVSAEACAADIKALLNVDLSCRLPEILTPTLIVHSAMDTTSTKDSADQLINSIPNTTAYCLEQGTHTAVISEYKRIAKVVAEFI